jgi:hypothetical protein
MTIVRGDVKIAVLVLLAQLAWGQTSQGRGVSTAEERTRFVEIAHKLEGDPLDRGLDRDRDWAMRWLIEVPDVGATVCVAVLGDFMKEKKYKYSGEIVRQLVFSSAAFTIEAPTKAGDKLTQYEAGVKGVLATYQAILRVQPEARSKSLDNLLRKQADGKLSDFIRDAAAKGCK